MNEVTIVSVDVPFFQLVWLMSKIIIASIPAIVVAGFIIAFWTFGFSAVYVFIQAIVESV